jgi:hypothetical protein
MAVPGEDYGESAGNEREYGDGSSRHTGTWTMVLGGTAAVAILLAVLGFILPWVDVNRGLSGNPSYAVINVPFVSELGLAWLALLVVIGFVGWTCHQRWLLILGALCALPTMFLLFVLTLLFHIVPHLVPLWLIPRSARPYVPDITGGVGPTLGFVSALIFTAWFVASAIVRPNAVHRFTSTMAHRTEDRLEQLWARGGNLVKPRQSGPPV